MPAELHLPTLGLTLSAQIVGLNASGAVVKPGYFPPAASEMVGMALSLSLVAGKDFYRIPGTIVARRDPVLLVTYSGAPQRIARRALQRLPCEIPAQYRADLSFGASGEWKPAAVTDINLAGIRLRVPGRVHVPGKIELRLAIPSPADPVEPAESATPAGLSVETKGRTRHARFGKDGRTIVGVKFEDLDPDAHLRIGCFLETLQEP